MNESAYEICGKCHFTRYQHSRDDHSFVPTGVLSPSLFLFGALTERPGP